MEYTNIAADVGHYNCVLSVENYTALATEQNESVVLPNCIETQESRSETFVTPEMISRGSRKFTTKVSGRARHKERSELLTSSPYRDNLKQMVLKKTRRGKSSKMSQSLFAKPRQEKNVNTIGQILEIGTALFATMKPWKT